MFEVLKSTLPMVDDTKTTIILKSNSERVHKETKNEDINGVIESNQSSKNNGRFKASTLKGKVAININTEISSKMHIHKTDLSQLDFLKTCLGDIIRISENMKNLLKIAYRFRNL